MKKLILSFLFLSLSFDLIAGTNPVLQNPYTTNTPVAADSHVQGLPLQASNLTGSVSALFNWPLSSVGSVPTVTNASTGQWSMLVPSGGGIGTFNGYGTNTTIGYGITNTFSNPVTFSGSSNAPVNGNYYLDSDTSSSAYTSYIVTNSEWRVTATIPVVTWGFVSVSYSPDNVWTNTVSTNKYEVLQYDFHATFPPNLLQLPTYYVLTNFSQTNGYMNNGTMQGVWSPYNGSGGPPTATLNAITTNSSIGTIISSGLLTPMSYSFAIQVPLGTKYTFYHNLGNKPHFVEWYLLCIHNDAGLGTVVGETVRLPLNIYSASYGLFDSQTYVRMTAGSGMLGNESNWQLIRETDGATSYPTSFTNFLLYVELYP